MARWMNSKFQVLVVLAALVSFIVGIGCAPTAATPTPTRVVQVAATAAPAATPTPTKPAPTPTVKIEKIKVGYTGEAGNMAPLWVTKDAGIFDKYGIDATLQFVSAGAAIMAALVAKDVEVAYTGAPDAISARLQGSDHIMIASPLKVMAMSIYVVPGIQSASDLKGKVVGVSKFGSGTDFGGRLALKKSGIDPDKDLTMVQTGGIPEALSAMNAGGVQGAVIVPPTTLQAKKLGFKELINIAEIGLPYNLPIVTTKSYADAHEDLLTRFTKALSEGVHKYKTDKTFAVNVIGKYGKIDDKEVLDESYDYFFKLFSEDLSVSIPGIETVLADLGTKDPKAKSAKAEDFVDLRFVKK